MFKRKNGQHKAILISLALVFAVGLVLGTLALYYVPDEILKEAKQTLELSDNRSFLALLKENLCFEILWILALWIFGSNSFTAPFTGAVVALRGFVLGFTWAFILNDDFGKGLLYTYVLPQCVTALPTMSLVALICILYGREKQHLDRGGSVDYLLYGIGFIFLAFLVAASESGLVFLIWKYFKIQA
ncbi:MAG: hypothetical protein IJC69_07365 [Clostridia bacterium]|nr:hypothetical protein [Clostridia bacterium]